jgi:hypothetical protein
MNNIYPPALHWSAPKFCFGQYVRLSDLPSPFMLYGCVIGISRPLLYPVWQYDVLIDDNSSLFATAKDSVRDLILSWDESDMLPFIFPSSIPEYHRLNSSI